MYVCISITTPWHSSWESLVELLCILYFSGLFPVEVLWNTALLAEWCEVIQTPNCVKQRHSYSNLMEYSIPPTTYLELNKK